MRAEIDIIHSATRKSSRALLSRNRVPNIAMVLWLPILFCMGFYCGVWYISYLDTYSTLRFQNGRSFSRETVSCTEDLNFTKASSAIELLVSLETRDTPAAHSDPSYCMKNPVCTGHCQSLHDLKATLKGRSKFYRKLSDIRIYADESLKSYYAEKPWFQYYALKKCHVKTCRLVTSEEEANVILLSLFLPDYRVPNITYAVLNLQAHSYSSLPKDAENVILISYRPESDILVNYGYAITHRMAMCKDQNIEGQTCENLQNASTPFYKWCMETFAGDALTCLFNVMPHITTKNRLYKNREMGLASTWTWEACENYDNYLSRLMNNIHIDRMGGCYNNRDEGQHPGLALKDHDSLWWGADTNFADFPSNFAERKIVLASHYWYIIVIENTIMDDYVTEKFYEGFLADTLMVYFGAPNARDYAPANHSYIHALDFESPEALAEFLLLLRRDRERYESYFWWKREVPAAISPRFREQMRLGLEQTNEDSMLCRLCTKLART